MVIFCKNALILYTFGENNAIFYDISDDKVITKEIADSFMQEKSPDKIRANNGIRIQLDLA